MIFSRDLGVDLGTAYTRIYASGRGIVLREPSVVAVDKNTGKTLAVGAAARNMLGRTPGNVVALRPIQGGVISDYDMTASMLGSFLKKVIRYSLVKPRVVVAVPSGISEVEERAVIQAAMEAGARRVYLIEGPLAAALGANLDVSGPNGHMVVDIGGGTTDIGVLSVSGVASSASIQTAGDALDEAIVKFVRRRFGVVIGLNTAEEIKTNVGCVIERSDEVRTQAKGRDLKTGLAREFEITSADMLEALKRPVRQITDEVLAVLEQTAPELVADISTNGIVLTGGGSQIYGMAQLLSERTGMECTLADDADSCVAYGCGKSLQWMNLMQEGTLNLARKRLMRDGL